MANKGYLRTMARSTPAGKGYVRFSDKLTASLQDITHLIEEHKTTMDTIQDVGIELTHTVASLASTASRYAKTVDTVLDTVFPLVINLPILDKRTRDFLTNLKTLADKILSACATSEIVARDVEQGLMNADVSKLKAHTGDLQKATLALQGILSGK
jgi:hypothetical protein